MAEQLPRASSLPAAAAEPQQSRAHGPRCYPKGDEALAFLDLHPTCHAPSFAQPLAAGPGNTAVVSTSLQKSCRPAKERLPSVSSTDSRHDAPAAAATCAVAAERVGGQLDVIITVGTEEAGVFSTSRLPASGKVHRSPKASGPLAVKTCSDPNNVRKSVSRPRHGCFAAQQLGHASGSAAVGHSASCAASIPQSPCSAAQMRQSTWRPCPGRYTQLPRRQALPGSPLYHPLPILRVLPLAAGNHWVDPNDLAMDLSKTLRHRQLRRTGQIGSGDPIPDCKKEQRTLRRQRLRVLAGQTSRSASSPPQPTAPCTVPIG